MADSNHLVSIDLRLLSGNLDRQLNGLKGKFNNAFSGFNSAATSQATGFFTSAWATAFNIVGNIGALAFRGITDEIKRSIEFQNDLIATTNSFQSLLNISFTEAQAIAQRANKEFLKSGLGLPFENFRETAKNVFSDDFLASFYDPKNVDASIKKTGDLLNRVSIVFGGITGVTNTQRTNFLNGFIGGSSLKNLQRLEPYRNSPQFSRVFEEQIAATGGEQNFNKLNRNERIQFLENITQKALPDETLQAYTKTLGAAFAKINSALFGDIGIFSFTRDLIAFIPGSSIINSLGGFFNELFRLDGVAGSILAGLSGVIDPFLLGIKLFFDGLTLILTPLNFVFSKLQILNPLIYGLSFALTTLAAVGLAKATAATVRGILVQSGAAVLGGGRLGLASMALGNTASLSGLALGNSLGFLSGATGGLKALAASGFASIKSGFVIAGAGIKSFSAALLPLLLNPLFWKFALIVGAIALTGYAIWKYWSPLKETFGGFWEGFLVGLEPVFEILKPFEEALRGIGEALKPIGDTFNALGKTVAPVGEALGGFFNGKQVEGTKADRARGFSAGKAVAEYGLPTYLTAINPGIGFLFSSLLNFGKQAKSNATGSPGLLGALLQESQNMPSGSRLAVANSSEAILTQSQQRQLLGGSRPSLTIQNLNVSGSNGRAIAQELMSTLDSLWSEAQSTYSTT